jgi:2-amino-4-hydroxy-6-hydroxymethyldihydropteridine diphosphokinase
MGDRPGHIRQALHLLRQSGAIELISISSLYRTKPWGFTEQDDFANLCVLGHTELEPEALLPALKAIEVQIGRAPSHRWGPRRIDIDLLFYGDLKLQTPELELPHRELFTRAFVLIPLAEAGPALEVEDLSIAELAQTMDRTSIVRWRRQPKDLA